MKKNFYIKFHRIGSKNKSDSIYIIMLWLFLFYSEKHKSFAFEGGADVKYKRGNWIFS